MRDEGSEAIFARHAACAAATRAGLDALGFRLFPDPAHASTTVTCVHLPDDLDWKDLNGQLKRRKLVVAGGQGKLSGKVFRIGHLGTVTLDEILGCLGAIEEGLLALGRQVRPGAGVAADHTLALMYGLARHLPEADGAMRRREWQQARAGLTGVELRGKTLGIIGLGKIGLAIADRARAMEMTVLAEDPSVTAEQAALRGIELVRLDDLLRRSDVVTVHVPLTRDTRGLIGTRQLALMKPTTLLLNVARGGVVDEPAVAAALRDGRCLRA